MYKYSRVLLSIYFCLASLQIYETDDIRSPTSEITI